MTIELPCEIGTKIYRLVNKRDKYGYYTNEMQISDDIYEIVEIRIYQDRVVYFDNSDDWFEYEDIGKSVFLSKEKAEKALKERKSNDENRINY